MKKRLLSALILISVRISFAQSIQLTNVSQSVFCSTGKDTVRFSVNYASIPQNSNIVFYQSTNPSFNPYLGQGDSIGFINVGGNTTGGTQITTTCPKILGIFIDACNQPPLNEWDNEYMVITSGSGFLVNNLKVDLPANPSINISPSSCVFTTPSAAMMTTLRSGTCNTTTLLAAGQGDSIPPNAIVIIFTGRGPIYPYNFTSYCSSGQPIYILQNSCTPGNGSFVNNQPSGCPNSFRTTTIQNRSCFDALTYAPCTLPPFDALNPNANDGNFVIRLDNTDTSSITNGGIRNNAADICNGLVFDSIVGNTIIKYAIPNDGSGNATTDFCNTGDHYIKAITHPNGTQPVSNALQFRLVCLDLTSVTSNNTICSGQNALINNSSSDPNALFSWTVSGGTNITGASSGTGNPINQTLTNTSNATDSITYIITAKDTICTVSKNVKIYVNPTPTAFNLGNDTTYCGNFSRVLSTGNPNTVWSTGVTAASITVTTAATYTATITNSCGSVSDQIVISKITVQPPINLGNDTAYCGTFSRILSTGDPSTVWSTGVTAPSITVTTAGTYTATISNSCGTVSDAITISQNPGLNFTFGTNTTTVCQGGSISLDAGSGFDTYDWSTGSIAQSINITLPGKYWVDVTKNGCSGSDTMNVIEITKPAKPDLGNDLSFCGNFSQVLSTGNPNTLWIKDFTSTITTAGSITVTATGTYTATVSNSCGAVSDTIVISATATQPPIFLGNDTSYCSSFSRVLSTGIPSTVWSTGIVAASITIAQPGKYWATITGACGFAVDTINITQSPGLSFTFGTNSTTVCRGGNITLDAGIGFDQYLWSTGQNAQSINITQPGTYWAEVTKDGCTGRDSIDVIEIKLPNKPSLGRDTSFCGTFSLTLSTGDNQTNWFLNTQFLTIAPSINATQAGTYIANISNSCGSVSDTVIIANSNQLNVNLGRDTFICTGANITLNATVAGNNIQYLWNTGEQTSTINVNAFGKYWVQVSSATCSVSDTIFIDEFAKPSPFVLGNDTSFCGSFSKTLFTGNVTTSWSTGDTAASIIVTSPGIFFATISNQCGVASDTIRLEQFSLPVFDLGNDTTICEDITLSIGNGIFTSVLWSTNDTINSVTVDDAGLYTVLVSNTNCSRSDSVRVLKECLYDVYLPTAFTPNNDGLNDILVPRASADSSVVLEFSIFNRWGERVFFSANFAPDDIVKGWDGRYKGEDCQVDSYVYFYKALLPDGKIKTHKGTVTLLR
ncbi:MAG: gliding motility-associated C-terminal domain-containing protein [Sphingobacteriales bacterium]|nr:gliding motility-associated C-terminal domain-containing protein [Sphingobacteriales bacterium]